MDEELEAGAREVPDNRAPFLFTFYRLAPVGSRTPTQMQVHIEVHMQVLMVFILSWSELVAVPLKIKRKMAHSFLSARGKSWNFSLDSLQKTHRPAVRIRDDTSQNAFSSRQQRPA